MSIEALASRAMVNQLTDEISHAEAKLAVTPENYERQNAYLDLKRCKRDIALLALGVQDLTESMNTLAAAIREVKSDVKIFKRFLEHYCDEKNTRQVS